MNWDFQGSGVALVTPFKENDRINYDKLAQLIDFQIKEKSDALVVAGTTGEASTLSVEEHKELIKKSVEIANNRIPVVAGTGSNETPLAIELSVQAQEAGASSLLIVTPYYNKTNTQGLIKHYEAIADAVDLPIILYNVPGRTGLNIPMEAMIHLSHNEKIVGVKEASGNITYAMEVKRLCAPDFKLIAGNDDVILPLLAVGGTGVISVLANILPKETHDIVALFQSGDISASRALQLRLNGFVHSLFLDTNPIPVKTALNLLGWEVGHLRLPLYLMDAEKAATMKVEMRNLGMEV